jgi:hypothetical protein
MTQFAATFLILIIIASPATGLHLALGFPVGLSRCRDVRDTRSRARTFRGKTLDRQLGKPAFTLFLAGDVTPPSLPHASKILTTAFAYENK